MANISKTSPFITTVTATIAIDYGFDVNHDAGTNADTIVNSDSELTAAIAAHDQASGQTRTIAMMPGKYRVPAEFSREITSDITLKRYGTGRVILTAKDVLTGWTLAGGGYPVGTYQATISTVGLEVDLRDLNLYEDDQQSFNATDRAILTDLDLFSYQKFYHQADSFNTFDVGGNDNFNTITDATIFSKYTEAELLHPDAYVWVYHYPNITKRYGITSYDAGTHTVTLDDTMRDQGSGEALYSLHNIPSSMQVGMWSAQDNGDGSATVFYIPRDVTNLTAGRVEYTRREAGVRVSTMAAGASLTLEGLECIRGVVSGEVGAANLYMTGGASLSRGDRSTIVIKQCRFGESSYTRSAAMAIEKATDLTIDHVTVDNADTFGIRVHDAENIKVSNIRADKTSSAYIVFTGSDDILIHHLYATDCGRGGHANQFNFYSGCSNATVFGVKSRDCFGYVTWQHSSNITFLFCSIACSSEDGRAFEDQNFETSVTIPTEVTRYKILNCETVPASTIEGTLSTGGAVNLNQSSAVVTYTAEMRNCLVDGGGAGALYTANPTHDPARYDISHNVYYRRGWWQTVGFSYSLETGSIDGSVGDDFSGLPTDSIEADILAAEVAWPEFNFRTDIFGVSINPLFPPIGAIVM